MTSQLDFSFSSLGSLSDDEVPKARPRKISFAAAFFDMASQRVEVKLRLPEGREPTVLDWRIAIASSRKHRARAPSYRWVFFADPDIFELLPNDRVLRFTDAAGGVISHPSDISNEQCKQIGFYMIPDLKSLVDASPEERNDRQVVLRAVEHAGHELQFASAALREVRTHGDGCPHVD